LVDEVAFDQLLDELVAAEHLLLAVELLLELAIWAVASPLRHRGL
jgi:hypothetical protein